MELKELTKFPKEIIKQIFVINSSTNPWADRMYILTEKDELYLVENVNIDSVIKIKKILIPKE